VPGQQDVRRIVLSLPGTVEDGDGTFTFRVNGRLLLWLWRERVDPKKAKVPNPGVVVIPVRDEMDKQTLIDLEPDVIFTEPHFDGYSMVLVRLTKVELPMLEQLIRDAWALQSAKPKGRRRRG
jgi:hypothetical protein